MLSIALIDQAYRAILVNCIHNQVHTGVFMDLLILEGTCILIFHLALQFCYCNGHEC